MKRTYCVLQFLLLLIASNLRSQTPNGYVDINGPDTVCTGSSGFMTLMNSTSMPAFWQVTTNGGINWSTINNSNTVNSFFMAANNLCYRAVLTNGDTSSTSCLIVDDSSNAGVITGGGAFCAIANGNLSVSSTVGNSLGWLNSVNNGQSFLPTGNNGLTQAFTNLSQTTLFAYIVKNGVCPIDTSFDTVFVSPQTNSGILSGNDTVCSSSNQGLLSLTNSSGTIIGWLSSSDSINWSMNSITNDTLSFQNLSQTTYYQVLVQSGICPVDTSNTVKIVIDNAPTPGTITGGGYFCGPPASGALTLIGSSGIPEWTQSNNGTSWQPTSCNGISCNFSNLTGTVYYRVELESQFGKCPSVFSSIDTVIHSPSSVAGTLSASADTLCAFTGNTVLTLAGNIGSQIIWQASVNGGSTWTNLTQFTGNTAFLTGLPANTLVQAIVSNNQCPSDTSTSIGLVVTSAPTVTILSNDTTINSGEIVNVIANGSGTPIWSPATGVSNPTSFSTVIQPNESGYYTITVSDVTGCMGMDSILITVKDPVSDLFISNAITPNNDGFNDEFVVEGIIDSQKNSLKIFNEYGHLVFSASPYKNDWKGTYNNSRLPDGTYFYVLEFTDLKKVFKGSITLMSQN